MCGIVGVAGHITLQHKKAFKDMLFLDQLRGDHSTGVLWADNKKASGVFKMPLPASDFLQHKGAESAINEGNRLLLGHNRYATQGKINKMNAHPFDFDNVAGVHNGTLRRQHLLPDHRQYEVDSENIYHAINTTGVDATIPLLDGAYALVWLDKKTGHLNMIRNNERPLWVAVAEDNSTIFWASEEWMICVSLSRHHIKHGKAYSLPVDTLHTFAIPYEYSVSTKEKEAFLTPVTKEIKGHPKVLAGVNGNGYSGYGLSTGTGAGSSSGNNTPNRYSSPHSYLKGAEVELRLKESFVFNAVNTTVDVSWPPVAKGLQVEVVGVSHHHVKRFKPNDLVSGTVEAVYIRQGVETLLVRAGTLLPVNSSGKKTGAHVESGTLYVGGKNLNREEFAELVNLCGNSCGMCGGPLEFKEGVTKSVSFDNTLYCGGCKDLVVHYDFEEKGYELGK